MSIVGSRIKILDSKDATKRGRRGEIVLETANTMILRTEEGKIIVEKKGTVLEVEGKDEPLAGDDLLGRLEDRIKEGKR